MKKLIAFCALAVLFGSTAQAQSPCDSCSPFYIGVSGGLSLLHDTEDGGVPIAFDAGGAFNAFLGWQEGNGRIEFETSKMNHDVDTVGGAGVASGNADIDAYMMNGYLDLPITSRLTGYVGGGLGLARAHANSIDNTLGGFIQATSDLGFAYQARVGATRSLTKRAEIFGGYRFLGTESLSLADGDIGGVYGDQINLHSLEVGLRMKF